MPPWPRPGLSLNEFEFPPHSGMTAIFDGGGPISVAFTSPVTSFSAFFSYLTPITLTAFDQFGAVLTTASSGFGSNAAQSGDAGSSPNELLFVSSVIGLSRVVIAGDPGGGSFVLDDLTVTTTVPEPSGLLLLAVGLYAGRRGRRVFRSQQTPGPSAA